MTPQYVLALGKEAIMVVLLAAAPMLAFGLVVGLAIAIFQAVTQIHEMTLTFVPKIIAVALALLVFLPWIISLVTGFTERLFGNIPNLVG
ncbi:MAG: flagellar biosynthesis protein FliQ [bacterium]